MTEATEKHEPQRRLSDFVREVKNAAADREDVVVEMREAQKMRIELLAAELAPVFAEVPAELDMFDFAVSSGAQPRLWIDAVSHVSMGRDRRTYRFLRDTRLGRVVLAESTELKKVADQVSRYIAERMIERERTIAGPVEPIVTVPDDMADTPVQALETAPKANAPQRSAAMGIMWLILGGAAFGVLVAAALLWERLAGIAI